MVSSKCLSYPIVKAIHNLFSKTYIENFRPRALAKGPLSAQYYDVYTRKLLIMNGS